MRYNECMKRRAFFKTTLAAVALTMASASAAVRAAVVDLCSKVRRRPQAMILPPIPKWSKLTDDIDGADFLRRSADYQRSLLPRDVVFPRTGQIWEAVRDCEAGGLRCLAGLQGPMVWAPTRLRKGDRVRILTLDHPKPLQVRFERLRPQDAHESHAADGLDGELSMTTARLVPFPGQNAACFSELFRLVEDVG